MSRTQVRRPGQHKDESAIEYLRRAVSNLNYETETLLESLPTIESLLDFFDLWSVYDTDFLSGIEECIADGDDPAPLQAFVEKYKLEWDVDAIIAQAKSAT